MSRYVWAAAVVVFALAAAPVGAPVSADQGQQAPGAARPVPRMPDGTPDVSGVWDKPARPNLADGLGPLPFTAAGRAKFEERVKVVDPVAYCYLPGSPRLMTHAGAFEIAQRPGKVIMMFEWMHNWRSIPTDGTPHLGEDAAQTLLGDPIGRWEGETLVVDTTHFSDDLTWLDDVGNQHSDALHLVERFTRVAYDRLQYEVTIEDPKIYTKPWTVRWTIPLARPGTELGEDTCVATVYGPGKPPIPDVKPGPR
ncbi:MAG: hypothetical protein HY657_00085 [Acidobacteria bacterium]|nr:hypothetical protein [Acidobacteriota bacterium]